MTPILIVADDLTGAADSAVQFRRAGFSAVVVVRPVRPRKRPPRAQVVSLNLDTRDASPVAVRRIWERQVPIIRGLAQGALVYQKIDSTLRGHAALEVRLLLACLGAAAAVIAPAFPKLGRYTIDGVHYVHGLPLAQTEYVQTRSRRQATSQLLELFTTDDECNPIHLPWQVIDRGVEEVTRWLRQGVEAGRRLIVADAADERHLDVLAQAVLPLTDRLLLVGSAGWAERLAMACKGLLAKASLRPGVLGVVGSLSSAATRQVQVAAQAGARVVPISSPASDGISGATVPTWQSVAQTLAGGDSAVFWTNPGEVANPARSEGQRLLHGLATIVRDLLAETPVCGVVLVGGNTAQAVLRALGATGLVLSGEVAPGIPHGRLLDGPFGGLPVVTKAGGFGADTALTECLKFLLDCPSQYVNPLRRV